jgi:CRP/FNR family transcriptional regulator
MSRQRAPSDLQRFEPFRSLSASAGNLLSQGVVLKRSRRSAAILHKGEPVSGAYVVLEGRLRVFTMSPSGAEATLYFIDPGEACVLAINCLFNDLLYPAWVAAESDTSVAVIPGHVYRKLFETESAIQNLTVQALSTLVFRLMTELEQVHSSTHRQRLVHFILLHAGADGTLHMTQQQIARHLGTTREVIARLIRDLVIGGCLRTRRGSIDVCDLFRLQRIITPSSS